MNRRLPFRALALLALLLLAACSGAGTKPDILDRTLYAYSAAIRWDEGNIDGALAFVDPEYQRKHPMSSVDLERFKHVRVSGYYVKGSQQNSETEYAQRVEIRLVNIHTQSERAIIDDQIWRWDEPAKTWFLTTGLPKIAETR